MVGMAEYRHLNGVAIAEHEAPEGRGVGIADHDVALFSDQIWELTAVSCIEATFDVVRWGGFDQEGGHCTENIVFEEGPDGIQVGLCCRSYSYSHWGGSHVSLGSTCCLLICFAILLSDLESASYSFVRNVEEATAKPSHVR